MKIKKKSLSHWKYFWPGCLQPFGCRLFFVSLCTLPPAHCCPLCPLHDTQLVPEASSWTVCFGFSSPPPKNMNTSGLLRFILSEPDWYMICHTSADIWGFWTLITLALFGRYRSCRHFQNSCVTARPNEHLWDWFQFVFSYFLKCIPPTHINDDDDFSLCFLKDKDENVWLLSGGWIRQHEHWNMFLQFSTDISNYLFANIYTHTDRSTQSILFSNRYPKKYYLPFYGTNTFSIYLLISLINNLPHYMSETSHKFP